MLKKKKEMEIIYEYAGDTEENRQSMEKAFDILFEATLSNLKVSSLSELVKLEVSLIPVKQLSDKDIQ